MVKNIQDHPIIATLAFIGAVIIGLANFTESLDTLKKEFKCVPVRLGIGDSYRGKVKLTYNIQKQDWVKIGTAKTTKSTGNHHCSKNCRGEPTRTNYKVTLSPKDYKTPKLGERKLKNPSLSCISGPCGGWNQILNVGLTDSEKTAVGSFDVWTYPTTWELTVDVLEYQVISEEPVEEELLLDSATILQFTVPNKSVSARIVGTMVDDKTISFEPGINDESNILIFNSKIKRDDSIVYKYSIIDNRCN